MSWNPEFNRKEKKSRPVKWVVRQPSWPRLVGAFVFLIITVPLALPRIWRWWHPPLIAPQVQFMGDCQKGDVFVGAYGVPTIYGNQEVVTENWQFRCMETNHWEQIGHNKVPQPTATATP